MKEFNSPSQEEFRQLFDEHWNGLYAFAYNILKNKQSVEDCVQNVFVDFWNRAHQIRILHTKAYLYQSVKNQCAKSLAKQKRFNYAVDLSYLATEPKILLEEKRNSKNEVLKEVYQQISLLPEKCQEVFRYSKIEKKSNKQIASELGISVSTVENHMNKALRLLRNALPNHLYILFVIFF